VRLTSTASFQVVTDPTQADAVFTDRIASNFEQVLKDTYATKSAEAKDDKDGTQDNSAKPTMQPLSRGKGSLFLVDRRTHVVLWSMFAKPKSSQADDMNQLATRIAAQLGKDRKSK
jgi:hypothetical protein